jgi:alpha-methylacyl-CoA racemase
MSYEFKQSGEWRGRGENIFDGGAPFYGCYACADGGFVSIGSIEPQFYRLLMELCQIDDPAFERQWDRQQWPALRGKLEAMFLTRTRDQWCELLDGTDVCFAPVLDFNEAIEHPHHQARGTFMQTDGVTHPAPAPRLSRTPAAAGTVVKNGEHTLDILRELGLDDARIGALRTAGAIA